MQLTITLQIYKKSFIIDSASSEVDVTYNILLIKIQKLKESNIATNLKYRGVAEI